MKRYETLFKTLLIGDWVHVLHGGKVHQGVLMDKYLADDNIFADILLDCVGSLPNKVLEHVPFFVGGQQVIKIIDKMA